MMGHEGHRKSSYVPGLDGYNTDWKSLGKDPFMKIRFINNNYLNIVIQF